MKKNLFYSIMTLVSCMLFSVTIFAQDSVVEFLPLSNKSKAPAKVTEYLQKEITQSLMDLNRVRVFDQGMIDGVKPAPGSGKVSPNLNAQVIVKNYLTTFGKSEKGTKLKYRSKATKGSRVMILGTVQFRDKNTDELVESVDFKGKYQSGVPKATTSRNNGEAKSTTPSKESFGVSMNPEVAAKRAAQDAVDNFQEGLAGAFVTDFNVTKILEGKNGDALIILIDGGVLQDVTKGATYELYTKKQTGPGRFKETIIGTIEVLVVKEGDSMAKVITGKDTVFQNVNGGNSVYARIKTGE